MKRCIFKIEVILKEDKLMKKIIAILIILIISLFNIILADPAPGENQTYSSKPPIEVVVNLSNK